MNEKTIKPSTPRSSDVTDPQNSRYLNAGTSDNTRLAYQSDINHFRRWGGDLPTTPADLIRYLECCAADTNPRTLKRRLSALSQWHRLKGHHDPTKLLDVTKTMKGIARLHGTPKQAARALRLEDIDKMAAHLNEQGGSFAARNKALLLVGFFGAFRRSELVNITWEQVEFVSDGMVITLPRSKTDQGGEGETCSIPFGDDLRCPVRALIDWRNACGEYRGFIFRGLSRAGKLNDDPLWPYHVTRIIQALVKAIELPNWAQYSSHSLRRGFATEADRLGVSLAAIQRHGRWRHLQTVLNYIETGRQFSDSAVKALFDF